MSPAASSIKPLVRGFAPIAPPDARVLILGTVPSRQSLEKHEYYGNPRNVFWRMIAEVFGLEPELPYADRAASMTRHRIAVWDVLRCAVRPGSSDAAILLATAIPNDFQAFFYQHPELELICFNGRKAAELYRRLVAPQGISTIKNIDFRTMPSTSPAYASMTVAEKIHYWSIIRKPGD